MQPERVVRERMGPEAGCLTAFLVLMILVNVIAGSMFGLTMPLMIGMHEVLPQVPDAARTTAFVPVLAGVNIICALLLLWRRRLGFWGLMTTGLISVVIEVSSHSIPAVVLGLACPTIIALLVRPIWPYLR